MKVEIHNCIGVETSKVEKTLEQFIGKNVERTLDKERSSLKVWLKQENPTSSSGVPLVSCGLLVEGPQKRDLYVKKEATNFSKAIARACQALKNHVSSQPSMKWRRKTIPFEGKVS